MGAQDCLLKIMSLSATILPKADFAIFTVLPGATSWAMCLTDKYIWKTTTIATSKQELLVILVNGVNYWQLPGGQFSWGEHFSGGKFSWEGIYLGGNFLGGFFPVGGGEGGRKEGGLPWYAITVSISVFSVWLINHARTRSTWQFCNNRFYSL